jgi:glycosyltransferase involved in cell wall biosynthesis
MMSNLKPLVSICVVTYNSSKYVLETLESAKTQTYKNVELIISDDSSTDNTVEMCREWVEKNKGRFVRAEIITTLKNTGISPNCNRGIGAAKGEWIKEIAGDDLLLPKCIETYLIKAREMPSNIVFFSKVCLFGDHNLVDQERFWESKYCVFDRCKSAQEQCRELIAVGNFLPAASSFYRKELWEKMHGFDEDIKLLEDRPFWLKCTLNGYIMHLVGETLVKYRVSENSIQLNSIMKLAYALFFLKYIYRLNFLFKLCVKISNQLIPKSFGNYIVMFIFSIIQKNIFIKRKL